MGFGLVFKGLNMSSVPQYKNWISELCLVTFDKLNLKTEEVFFRNVLSLSCNLVTMEMVLVDVDDITKNKISDSSQKHEQ